jgi:hypothetical protein
MSDRRNVLSRIKTNRLDEQTWEEALRADKGFWRLTKAERTEMLSWAKKKDRQTSQPTSVGEPPIPLPPETPFVIEDGITPEEATREKVKRDAELYPLITATPLKYLPIQELAKLERWMVPPSRINELREYQNMLRRKDVAARDCNSLAKQSPRPGDKWADPRGYWSRQHHGNPSKTDCPSNAPAKPGEVADLPDNRGPATGVMDINAMTANQLQELILSGEFNSLPEMLRHAVTDRFLMLEGVAIESFWRALEEG